MKVFKFGGASVKDAAGVANVGHVLAQFPNERIVVVVSAMGKMTNAFEALLEAHMQQKAERFQLLDDIKTFHVSIADELAERSERFKAERKEIDFELDAVFGKLLAVLQAHPSIDYDQEYDQLVSWGEVLSTKIVSAWLNAEGIRTTWLDARQLIRTDSEYRNAGVDWDTTKALLQRTIERHTSNEARVAIIQGFIGHDANRHTTTLGREGSDFTGAILSHALDAESFTVWKDVPGVLSADPKHFPDAVLLPHISFREAIELSYYGASIIHPRTIQPLQNKDIPLFVRSFTELDAPGTRIDGSMEDDRKHSSFIFKRDQVLISITPKDFSFIVEKNLVDIFQTFTLAKVKINMIQNSAINFSACVNTERDRVPKVIGLLEERYKVRYNEPVELLTVRHYDQALLDQLTAGKEVLLEQRTRETARFVMR